MHKPNRPLGTASGTMIRCVDLARLARPVGWRLASAAAGAVAARPGKQLEELRFDNSFVRELPGDPEKQNALRQVKGAMYSFVSPTPSGAEPYLVAYSREVCQLLDLDPEECLRPEFPLLMSGSAPLPGSQPYAQCYGGHQFGNWAGQLGDGRAITLGETVNSRGERWELQLKGAGRTPYSRHADGRAVLRSSIRELVASEALHHLGVPTTRALCCVGTGEGIYRDMFYNGDVKMEPGAVVCRVSPSFVRFGTFQLPVSRGGMELQLVQLTADYVIRHHFPHLKAEGPDASPDYLGFLQEVTQRSAELVAKWQSIGFVHGVLNTDNMSILGLTIDYGPFGFLDAFDPDYTPNLTDTPGRRYSFRAQPEAVQWNLVQLANALLAAGLVEQGPATEVLEGYSQVLLDEYNGLMAAKLGLASYDRTVSTELLRNMFADKADFTNTYRSLSSVCVDHVPSTSGNGSSGQGEDGLLPPELQQAIGWQQMEEGRREAWGQWMRVYRQRLREDGVGDVERHARQDGVNPAYIPRQHLLQLAIERAEAGDYSRLEELMRVLRWPYTLQPGTEHLRTPPPPDMIRPGVCMLSCSS